jgi:SET domain-containing protein
MRPIASYHSPKVEVRDAGPKGLGLFARQAVRAGEIAVVTGGRILTAEQHAKLPDQHLPFQVDTDLHLAPITHGSAKPGEHREGIFATNHSCGPNAGIVGQSALVAMRDIAAGEEITFDYVMTDSDAVGITPFEMKCLCGDARCRGLVTDRDWRKPELRARYKGYFSPYLQARIDGEAEDR